MMPPANPGRRTVLVTGASGLIGAAAAHDLSATHRVRALNRRASPPFETVQADIADLDAIRPAFEGVHTVVHLSALLIEATEAELTRVNLVGTQNVFAAAAAAGVRRIIFASSGSVMGGYHGDEPFKSLLQWRDKRIPEVARRVRAGADDYGRPWRLISERDPVRPTVFYAYTKVAGEALGRLYHETKGISVICIRFGAVNAQDRPRSASAAAVFMSRRDAAQVIRKSVEAPDSVGFETFYALSDNAARFRDLERARDAVGYRPQDGIMEWPIAGEARGG